MNTVLQGKLCHLLPGKDRWGWVMYDVVDNYGRLMELVGLGNSSA